MVRFSGTKNNDYHKVSILDSQNNILSSNIYDDGGTLDAEVTSGGNYYILLQDGATTQIPASTIYQLDFMIGLQEKRNRAK